MTPTSGAGFDGAVVLVTGAASGIGRQCALTLAEDGARVLAADLNATGLSALAEDIGAKGGDIATAVLDITDRDACRDATQLAVSRWNRIDSVVHAAGVMAVPSAGADRDGPLVPLVEQDPDGWDRALAVNLTGGFNVLQAVFGVMLELGRPGSAVVITSGGSVRPLVGRGAYCVAKAGLAMLVKMFAEELAASSIRVNAVAPGVVETPMTADLIAAGGTALSAAPLGRYGTPHDIASAVRFLLSADASFITGKTLYVDGGVFSG